MPDDAEKPTQPDAGESSVGDYLVPPTRQGGRAGDLHGTGPASHVPSSLRHVDWAGVFPFVHLFKGFRLAVHPPKLLLALAAVLLIYGGARLLDGVWNLFPRDWQAVPGEVELFERYRVEADTAVDDFADVRRRGFDEIETALEGARRRLAVEGEGDDLYDAITDRRDRRIARAFERLERDLALEGSDADALDAARERDVRAAYADAAREAAALDGLRGVGPWELFYDYETARLNGAAAAVLSLDLPLLIGELYRGAWVGPSWALTQHTLYSVLLALWALIVLAVFGGALSRIAAVQVARDEKIGLRSALRFSTGKFVSFLSAPLIPLLVIGLLVAAAAIVMLILSLIGMIPLLGWVPEVGAGLLFPLALIGGFIVALTLVGLVGGLALMYPTIAAEGTDSFDAISRSFSYLFARPWRLAFYALVALAYGVVTFLALRLFVWLALVATHAALRLGSLDEAAGTDLIDGLYPRPAAPATLSYDVPFVNLDGPESVGAFLIAAAVYTALALLTAYALSLFLSLGTIVYFLMRREVDATEMDEVYLDPADEEYAGYADVPDDPDAEEPAASA